MECPRCHQKMKSGYIHTTTSGGICWVKKKHTILPPAVDEEYMMLSEEHLFLTTSLPAYNCMDCKIVIAEYSEA